MLEDAEYTSMTMDKIEEPTSGASTEEPVKKESLAKQVIKQAVGIGLAGGLLYWCFKGQNIAELWRYAQEIDLRYVLVVCVTGLLSHISRAWRWVLLLQPLSDRRISLWNSFCAVMYGYAVNLVVPRGGEVARLVSISKTESIPWAGVLPTMFIDRLLDLAMLVLLMGLTISRLPAGILDPRVTGPAGILMCIAVFAGLIALPFVGKIGRAIVAVDAVKKSIPQGLFEKIDQLLMQFDLGTRSLTRIGNLVIISFFSLLIWVCYYANVYFMLRAFRLENLVDASKTLVVFTVGAVGVLVPTPGSVGSFHILTSQSLEKVAGVNSTQALAFATVTHIMTFIVLACVPAAICFVVQSAQRSKKSP